MGIFQNTGPTPKAKDGFMWAQEPVQKIPQEKASEAHCVSELLLLQTECVARTLPPAAVTLMSSH